MEVTVPQLRSAGTSLLSGMIGRAVPTITVLAITPSNPTTTYNGTA
jgi:hypothetical protein